MRILLVGSGAREHALAWKLGSSPLCETLYVWPGNPAMPGEVLPLSADAAFSAVGREALARGIDLVVVGPEKPLSEGLADTLTSMGLATFGPRQNAARLESSKAFAKQIMHEAGIPTAASKLAESRDECGEIALTMLRKSGGTVLKASGLAAGKGVFVCRTEAQVYDGITRLYGPSMQEASKQIVVEEILEGRECSYFSFLGAKESLPLGFAVDFKRLEDNDQGPNTGGMGCYTPVPWLPLDAGAEVERLVVGPLQRALAARGIVYVGCLYVGLMWGSQGPMVVEFNCRLGDPEAQVLAVSDPRDWVPLMAESAGMSVPKASRAAGVGKPTVGVVMASSGYPYGERADDVALLDPGLFSAADKARVFAASISHEGAKLRTGKGRVLTVVAAAPNFAKARHAAYEQVGQVAAKWPSARFRRDIALLVAE